MRSQPTLYCIADEAGFRLLRGEGANLQEVLARKAASLPGVEHEFSSSGRNRGGSGASFGHEATTKAEVERPRLARHIVMALADEWAKAWANQIVIAAGPKMLGALRDAMPKALAGHIAAEVAKDLSDVPAHDLAGHLKDHVSG